MKRRIFISTAFSLVLLLFSGTVFAQGEKGALPIAVFPEGAFDKIELSPVFVEIGNIYELTGVQPDFQKDGVIFRSLDNTKKTVNELKQITEIASGAVIGCAETEDEKILVIQTAKDTFKEYVFTQNEVLEFDSLELKTLGSWASSDGAVFLAIKELELFVPNKKNKGEFTTLSIRQYHYTYTTPGAPFCNEVAGVEAWLDTDIWDFIAVIKASHFVPGTDYQVLDDRSIAIDAGLEAYGWGIGQGRYFMEGPYETPWWWHEYHEAEVWVTLGGACSYNLIESLGQWEF